MFYPEDFQKKKKTIEYGFAQCWLRKYLKNIPTFFWEFLDMYSLKFYLIMLLVKKRLYLPY